MVKLRNKELFGGKVMFYHEFHVGLSTKMLKITETYNYWFRKVIAKFILVSKWDLQWRMSTESF